MAHCESSKTRQGTGCVWDGVWRMQVIHEPICTKCLMGHALVGMRHTDVLLLNGVCRDNEGTCIVFTGPLAENASKKSTDSLHKWRNGKAKQCSTKRTSIFLTIPMGLLWMNPLNRLHLWFLAMWACVLMNAVCSVLAKNAIVKTHHKIQKTSVLTSYPQHACQYNVWQNQRPDLTFKVVCDHLCVQRSTL